LQNALLAVDDLGEGEPLLLIHGLATTRAIWHLVAPQLAHGRRVVTVDVPGFGESAAVSRGFDLRRVAERIARGLAARGVHGPLDLVGHSLGGGIALTLAASRPRLVRRLVLVAPAGLQPIPWPAPLALSYVAPIVLAVRRRAAPLTELPWGRRILLATAAADGARIAPAEARLVVDASAGAQRTGQALAAITRADLRPLLGRTPAALGVLWGSDDRTIPVRGVEAIRARRPDAEVEVIPRAGHVAMVERPEAFAEALQKLLDRLPKDATTPRHRPTTLP
jgi:pimeloyl-ACP methyl ester carboxylesterase